MPSRDPRRRFADILENIDRIERYLRDIDRQSFDANEIVQDAVKHCLLRIAEAATKLGAFAEEAIPGQNWRSIRDLGNILRHEYDGVSLDILWAIVSDDMPALEDAILRAGYSLSPGDDQR